MSRLGHNVARSAAKSVAFGYTISFGIRFFGNLLLTRFLTPEVFGVMLIASSIHMVATLYLDVGLANIVLRKKGPLDKKFVNSVWTLQVLQSIGIAFICLAVAFVVYALQINGVLPETTSLGMTELPKLLLAIAFVSLIGGFKSLRIVVAAKNFNQPLLVRMELYVQVSTFIVTAILAWQLKSVWALALGIVFSQSILVTLSHRILPGEKDAFFWNPEVLTSQWANSKWVLLSSITSVTALHIDKFILGSVAYANSMGLYAIALGLITAVEAGLSKVIGSVCLPVLIRARAESSDKMHFVYQSLVWKTECCCFFAIGGLMLCGLAIVRALYPAGYTEAGNFIPILATGVLIARTSLSSQFFLAIEKTNYIALMSIFRFVLAPTAIIIGYQINGFYGALTGISINYISVFLFAVILENKHHVELSFKRFLLATIALLAGGVSGWFASKLTELVFPI